MSFQTPLTSTTNYGVVKVGSGISVTAGVISVAQGVVATTVVTGASPAYAIVDANEYIGVIASGVATLTLPVGTDGKEFVIKAEFGNTANVQLNTQAGEFIEGSAGGYLLDIGTVPYSYPSVTVVYRLGNNNWNVV